MTRLMLWTLLLALVLILGGILAQMMIADPGVMMFTWKGWIVETTFWSGIALILTSVITIIALIGLFKRFGPARLLSSYRNRRDQKVAKKETAIAIDSWLHGREERALQAIQRVASAGGSDRLPHAVSLAIGLDNSDWLERMAQFINQEPELKLFALALQAERTWQQGKTDEFVALLKAHPALAQVSWLRERSWQAMLEQNHAVDLVTYVNEAAGIQPDVRQRWLERAVQAALKQGHGKTGVATAVLKTLTKAQKNSAEILTAEIEYLVSIDEHNQAFKRSKVLLAAVDQRERCDLLLALQVDTAQKLTLLESLATATPGPVYCRTAGIVNLQMQLWGQAQNWLEQGWALKDRTCGLELAKLFEQRNMVDQSARLYRELATSSVDVN